MQELLSLSDTSYPSLEMYCVLHRHTCVDITVAGYRNQKFSLPVPVVPVNSYDCLFGLLVRSFTDSRKADIAPARTRRHSNS